MKSKKAATGLLIALMVLINTGYVSAAAGLDPDSMAVYLSGDFDGRDNARIEGDLYTAFGDVTLRHPMYSDGNFYHAQGTSYTYPLISQYDGYDAKDMELASTSFDAVYPGPVPFPSIPDYVESRSNYDGGFTISEDTHFGTLAVNREPKAGGDSRKIVFDTSQGNLYVVVENLNISKRNTMEVTGGNKLFLFVRNANITQKFRLNNQSGNPDRVFIVSESYLPIDPNERLVANVMYSGIDHFVADGHVSVTGSIITDATTVTYNTHHKFEGLFYAPSAAVSMSGGSTDMVGRMVADSLSMIDSSKIVYGGAHAALYIPPELTGEETSYFVSTAVSPAESGAIFPQSAVVSAGETLHFSAVPAEGYEFAGYTSSSATMAPDGEGNIVVTGDVTITAHFEAEVLDPGYRYGILGEYYDAYEPTNESALKMKRIDSQIAMNWEYDRYPDPERMSLGREDFSVRWSGFLRPRVSGAYTFKTLSDDGVRLYIGEEKLLDNWGLFSFDYIVADRTIEMVAGQYYPITLEYQQGPLYAATFMFWEADGLPMELVPAKAYFVSEDDYDAYATAKYYNQLQREGEGLHNAFYVPELWPSGEPVFSEISGIYYEWGSGAPSGIATDEFYGRFAGWLEAKYTEDLTLIFTVDDAIKVWIDGDLVVDKWEKNSRIDFPYTFSAVSGTKYKIEIEYADFELGATLIMWWEGASHEKQVVPKEYLYAVGD